MKIGLITYPVETNPTGIGVHVLNMARALLETDRKNTYFLLHFTPSDHVVYQKNEILYKRFKYLPVMFSDSWYLRRNPGFFDIVHRFSPGGFWFNIRSKIVITVHDLFSYHAYHFNRKTFSNIGRIPFRNALKKADALAAVSAFTRDELLKSFPGLKHKIHVIPNASGIGSDKNRAGSAVLEKKYGVPGRYILFVSTIEPRKNLISLVRAYERLRAQYDIDEYLVIVGKNGWDFKDTLSDINGSHCRDRMVFAGFVPDEDLPLFYERASLFVYPSFMEGFGIPPLEAMSLGCPVLTSNTSSLPEVMGHPDMMFDPDSPEQIAQKSIRVLRDESVRKRNIARGKENAQRYSWARSAQKLIRLYNRIGKGCG